jgi:integrase
VLKEEAAMKIAVIGRGSVGGGLRGLWERAGHEVDRIGRDGRDVSSADAVLVAVPGDAIAEALDNVEGIEGKTAIDATNLCGGAEPPAGFASNAEFVRSRTNGPTAKSFNANYAALYDRLADAGSTPSNLWCGDKEARAVVERLNRDAGYESVYAGPLENAAAAELVSAGSEAGTIRNTFNVVRLVFGAAVDSGAIRANPCTGIRMPKSTRSEMLFLEPEQIVRLADAITPAFRTLILVAAYTGLRAGEIGALRVGRVDVLRGSADVRESLSDVNGKLVFGPTKTYAHRTVRLPRFLCDELAQHLAGRAHCADELVFTSASGSPLRHNLFYARHFKPAVRMAGLPPALRFHDLRHTCAALLIAQGAHPKAIMERLGHSSIQVTLDRYGHLFPSLDESLTDGLEATYQASLSLRAAEPETSVAALR